jgi:CRISPR-associated endonuclease Cas1
MTVQESYRDYAARAARPYTERVFVAQWRIRQREADNAIHAAMTPVQKRAEAGYASEVYWSGRCRSKTNVMALTHGSATLRVRGGCLEVFDGERVIIIHPTGKRPQAIVLGSWGGIVTLPAVRFCAEHRIGIVFASWMHGLMSFVAPDPKACADLVRQQVLADPVPIARALVSQKIRHCEACGCLSAADRRWFLTELKVAGSVAQIMRIEARSGVRYWSHRTVEMQPRTGARIPPAWRQFSGRMGLSGVHHKRATHPVNAILNLAYAMAAGRLGAWLAASGACLALGFLHADKAGRRSLVADAIEPLRSLIDSRVFKFVADHRFSKADFVRTPSGEIRFVESLTKMIIQETSLPETDIVQAGRFMLGVVKAASPAKVERPAKRVRRSRET